MGTVTATRDMAETRECPLGATMAAKTTWAGDMERRDRDMDNRARADTAMAGDMAAENHAVADMALTREADTAVDTG